jgi:hypothetical protein
MFINKEHAPSGFDSGTLWADTFPRIREPIPSEERA